LQVREDALDEGGVFDAGDHLELRAAASMAARCCPSMTSEGTVPCGDSPYSSGTSNSATMLMILISGLIAGPAVSL
jgi:hypothetical protein